MITIIHTHQDITHQNMTIIAIIIQDICPAHILAYIEHITQVLIIQSMIDHLMLHTITHTTVHYITVLYMMTSITDINLIIHHIIIEIIFHTHISTPVHTIQDIHQSEAYITMIMYTTSILIYTIDHIIATIIQAHYGLLTIHQDIIHIYMVHYHQAFIEEDIMMMNIFHIADTLLINMN